MVGVVAVVAGVADREVPAWMEHSPTVRNDERAAFAGTLWRGHDAEEMTVGPDGVGQKAAHLRWEPERMQSSDVEDGAPRRGDAHVVGAHGAVADGSASGRHG